MWFSVSFLLGKSVYFCSSWSHSDRGMQTLFLDMAKSESQTHLWVHSGLQSISSLRQWSVQTVAHSCQCIFLGHFFSSFGHSSSFTQSRVSGICAYPLGHWHPDGHCIYLLVHGSSSRPHTGSQYWYSPHSSHFSPFPTHFGPEKYNFSDGYTIGERSMISQRLRNSKQRS